ncbi:MAG: hypothetical protein KDI19_10265 [Pseudomonadales bacterium]|nr:hypothetical protein [Pseudomonadales bacterium]
MPADVVVETGVLNRSIYQIAIPEFWNRKLVFKFGGGCRAGWYRQGDQTAGVLDSHLLDRGYAVASASLNVFGINCNDLLAAETMMMVKERFVEAFGVPAFTIGFGCSGGSYQSHQIGDNYPGLLDGILVGCSFPEVGHAMVTVLVDARLLKHYFDWANAETDVTWSEAQQLAVGGFANMSVLARTAEGAGRVASVPIDGWPSAEFDDVVPATPRFDPTTMTGARPTVFDHTVNVYGRDPVSGKARWPLDNRGIEYGLSAWREGKISTRQFLHLNRFIGGLDRDGRFVAQRIAHDPEATRAAYSSGRILDGGGGLNDMPIIDYRAWADARDRGDTHLRYHSFSTRARLVAANGDAGNHVMLTEDGLCDGCSLFSLDSPVLSGALDALDKWLTAIRSDRQGSLAERVRRDKPQDVTDACWIDGQKIVERQQMGAGRCDEVFHTFGFPRLEAGAPIANNIVACARRPLDETDVAGMSPVEADEMRQVFPDGVCDWTRSGEAQVRPHQGGWWQFAPDAG